MSTTNPTKIRSEWEILQAKYGNLPEPPKEVTNEEKSQMLIHNLEQRDYLETKSLNELHELEDDLEEEVFEYYRKRRLEEYAREKERYRFGSVVHVGKDEYIEEVTEASKSLPDINVILLLYNECHLVCQLLIKCFETVALKHGYAKFCIARGSDVIPNLPEARLPAVLVYKNGMCMEQILGGKIWGNDRTNSDMVEWVLWKKGVLEHAESSENPLEEDNVSVKHKAMKGRIEYKNIQDESRRGYSSKSNDNSRPVKDDRCYSSTLLESVFNLKS